MTVSPLVATIVARLKDAGYDDLQTPFRIAGVEFQFTAAMRGRDGRALDLVLLVDTTAGDFGDSSAVRVRDRVQALSHALDVTGSRYVVTAILAGAVLSAEIESLAETCRVLHVDTVDLDATGALGGQAAMGRLEDRIGVLLPLLIPREHTGAEKGSAWEQLTRTLPDQADAGMMKALMAASELSEQAVTETIGRLIDDTLGLKAR